MKSFGVMLTHSLYGKIAFISSNSCQQWNMSRPREENGWLQSSPSFWLPDSPQNKSNICTWQGSLVDESDIKN